MVDIHFVNTSFCTKCLHTESQQIGLHHICQYNKNIIGCGVLCQYNVDILGGCVKSYTWNSMKIDQHILIEQSVETANNKTLKCI